MAGLGRCCPTRRWWFGGIVTADLTPKRAHMRRSAGKIGTQSCDVSCMELVQWTEPIFREARFAAVDADGVYHFAQSHRRAWATGEKVWFAGNHFANGIDASLDGKRVTKLH